MEKVKRRGRWAMFLNWIWFVPEGVNLKAEKWERKQQGMKGFWWPQHLLVFLILYDVVGEHFCLKLFWN